MGCNILVITLLSILCVVFCDDFPIDWTHVSNTNDRDITSNSFGSCICDLTATVCDIHCCCDPDCPVELQSLAPCLPERKTTLDYKYCLPEGDVYKINRVESTTFEDQICVLRDNRLFNRDVDPIVTDEQFDEIVPSSPNSTAVPVVALYKEGDPLILLTSSNQYIDMSFPSSSFSIECTDANPASFWASEQHQCTRTVTDIAVQCTTIFDVLSYTSFGFAKSPNETSVLIPLHLVSVIDLVSNATATGTMLVPPDTTYDALNQTCNNAVLEVDYTIFYNSIGTITQASAAIVIGSVAAGAADIAQTFSINFVQDGASVGEVKHRSGNPGYLTGWPVVAGRLITNGEQQAIAQDTTATSGLQILGSSNNECAPNSVTVTFGEDTISGCFVALTQDDLSGVNCTHVQSQTLSLLQGPDAERRTHVGMFGDASYLNISDWVQIIEDPIAGIPSSSPIGCPVIAEMNYQFLVADVGSISNPQSKIIGVRIQYTQEYWKFTCVGSAQCQDTSSVQNFELRSTARFYSIKQQAQEKKSKNPPFLPTVPKDIFYPFFINAAARSGGIPVFNCLIVIVVVFLLMQ